jgi:hypothetical protein
MHTCDAISTPYCLENNYIMMTIVQALNRPVRQYYVGHHTIHSTIESHHQWEKLTPSFIIMYNTHVLYQVTSFHPVGSQAKSTDNGTILI